MHLIHYLYRLIKENLTTNEEIQNKFLDPINNGQAKLKLYKRTPRFTLKFIQFNKTHYIYLLKCKELKPIKVYKCNTNKKKTKVLKFYR